MGIQLNPLLKMKVGGEDQSEKRWVGGWGDEIDN